MHVFPPDRRERQDPGFRIGLPEPSIEFRTVFRELVPASHAPVICSVGDGNVIRIHRVRERSQRRNEALSADRFVDLVRVESLCQFYRVAARRPERVVALGNGIPKGQECLGSSDRLDDRPDLHFQRIQSEIRRPGQVDLDGLQTAPQVKFLPEGSVREAFDRIIPGHVRI